MRRALALLLALALLGAAGLVCAHRAVGASAEAVEMRETVLCGDSSAARGIMARVPLYAAEHLFWDTETVTEPGSVPVTSFRYSAAREYPGGGGEHGGLYVNVMTNMGAGGSFGKDFDFEDHFDDYVDSYYAAYGDILRDVASRTAPGERHHEYVELSEWMDYLPLRFEFDLPGFIYVYDSGEEFIETTRGLTQPLGRKLAECFRIPLPGPATVNVSISRNVDGDIVEWNIENGLDRDDYEPGEYVGDSDFDRLETSVGCLSAVTDEACYFVFDQWTSAGEEERRVDFSGLPGGRGVYRLPLEVGEYTSADGSFSTGEATRLRLDEIEAVLPVADDEHVELLHTDGKRLLLFTVEDGKLFLTQAPVADLSDVRKTELTELAELENGDDGWDRVARAEGLYYLETVGGRALLLESVDGGEYELVLNVPRDFQGSEESLVSMLWEKNIRESYGYDSALLWDGERFAMAHWCSKNDSYRETAGFVLSVYDKTGLLYCGLYESSLCRAPTEMHNDIIESAGDLELSWK